MNIYDDAHALVRSIKASQEYITYIAMKDKVNANPELAGMLNDFRQRQFQFQAQQLIGGEQSSDMMQQIQSLYEVLAKDPLAAEYLQAEMIFTKTVSDIYAILGEVINLG